jgi:hypothetical protein
LKDSLKLALEQLQILLFIKIEYTLYENF